MARDLNLDLGSGHTAYHRASLIDLYLFTKFHSNRRNFLWTDGRTDVRTDGHFPPILLGRLLEVDLIIIKNKVNHKQPSFVLKKTPARCRHMSFSAAEQVFCGENTPMCIVVFSVTLIAL